MRPRYSLDEACDAAVEKPSVTIVLDDALEALENRDAMKARLIEMRFLGGLTAEESVAVNLPVNEVRRASASPRPGCNATWTAQPPKHKSPPFNVGVPLVSPPGRSTGAPGLAGVALGFGPFSQRALNFGDA